MSVLKKKIFSDKEFDTLSGLWKIDKVILDTLKYDELVDNIVNSILTELDYLDLGYEIIVLTLANRKKKIIERISISKTKTAEKSLKETPIPFSKIEVPLSSKTNLLSVAVRTKKKQITHDLSDVLYPAGTREEWRRVQKICGIKTSVVLPVISRDKCLGAMIFSLSKSDKKISKQEWQILYGFSVAVGIALENSRLYQRLEQVNKELKSLDKLKDEFLNVAAHELRAPLTAVKGYLSMIAEGDAGAVNKEVKKFLNGALEGTEREIRLVNNMLNMSRIEEKSLVYNMGEVELASVVNFAYEEFKVQAKKKGLDFSIYIEKKVKDLIYVDKDRIYEVVANLISNAVKYTDKGSVKVKLFNPSAKIVRFEVTDTGYGVSEKEQKKLFTKFFRSESSAGKVLGTGLGLYIIKLLIEEFKGKLGYESELGKGSMFWFELNVRG